MSNHILRMEIESLDNNSSFTLNNILKSNINKYNLFFNTVKVKDVSKFIMSVYQHKTLILRFEYYILGSYNKTKNVWIWADQSQTLDKSIIMYVKNLRDIFRSDKTLSYEKYFIDHDYYVLSTIKLMKCMSDIGVKLFNDYQYQIVTFLRTDDIIDFYISKRILFERIFY